MRSETRIKSEKQNPIMNSQLIPIEYAHCIKWTQGQLDCAPYSRYELRSVCATLRQYRGLLDEPTEYLVTFDGVVIGDGDSDNEAIAQARYWLMNESRKKAMTRAVAILNPNWLALKKQHYESTAK